MLKLCKTPYDFLRAMIVTIRSERKFVGTGCLVPAVNSKYSYVLTARHCIYEIINEKEESFVFSSVPYPDISFYRYKAKKPLTIIDSKYLFNEKDNSDLIAIKVEYVNDIVDLLFTKFKDPKEEDLFICGYPEIFVKSEEQEVIIKSYVGNINNNLIHITADTSLSTPFDPAKDNCAGLSGSGIFIRIQNKYKLAGIINRLPNIHGAFNFFKGYKLEQLSTFLTEKEIDIKVLKNTTREEDIIENIYLKIYKILAITSIERYISKYFKEYSDHEAYCPYYLFSEILTTLTDDVYHFFSDESSKNELDEIKKLIIDECLPEPVRQNLQAKISNNNKKQFRVPSPYARGINHACLEKVIKGTAGFTKFIYDKKQDPFSESAIGKFKILYDQVNAEINGDHVETNKTKLLNNCMLLLGYKNWLENTGSTACTSDSKFDEEFIKLLINKSNKIYTEGYINCLFLFTGEIDASVLNNSALRNLEPLDLRLMMPETGLKKNQECAN